MQEKKKSKFRGILAVGYKANVDVKCDRELPDLSYAKMFSCVKKKKIGALLENDESCTGQFTLIKFFFCFFFCLVFGRFCKGVLERK